MTRVPFFMLKIRSQSCEFVHFIKGIFSYPDSGYCFWTWWMQQWTDSQSRARSKIWNPHEKSSCELFCCRDYPCESVPTSSHKSTTCIWDTGVTDSACVHTSSGEKEKMMEKQHRPVYAVDVGVACNVWNVSGRIGCWRLCSWGMTKWKVLKVTQFSISTLPVPQTRPLEVQILPATHTIRSQS